MGVMFIGSLLQVRGDLNVLLCGDPGTAKSCYPKYFQNIAPSRYSDLTIDIMALSHKIPSGQVRSHPVRRGGSGGRGDGCHGFTMYSVINDTSVLICIPDQDMDLDLNLTWTGSGPCPGPLP